MVARSWLLCNRVVQVLEEKIYSESRQGIPLGCLLSRSFNATGLPSRSKALCEHLSKTCCHQPARTRCHFGTAPSSRLEVDCLQPVLEPRITSRANIIVLTASLLGRKKSSAQQLTARRMSPCGSMGTVLLWGSLALPKGCYFGLPNQSWN